MIEKYIDKLKNAFIENRVVKIPTLNKGVKKIGYFTAILTDKGIEVNNLGNQNKLLPFEVFQEVIGLLIEKGGKAKKGSCMGPKLGSQELPLDSVEGRVANKIYNQKAGDSVFRRITSISCILAWAGICKNGRGYLELSLIN